MSSNTVVLRLSLYESLLQYWQSERKARDLNLSYGRWVSENSKKLLMWPKEKVRVKPVPLPSHLLD